MNDFYQHIEAYLDDELRQDEKNAFENALQNDADLQKAVAEEKATRATLYLMMTERFRQKAMADEQNTPVVALRPFYTKKSFWAIAASVIGICFFTFLMLNQKKEIDYVALASNNIFEYPVPKEQNTIQENNAKNSFFTAIKKQDFDAAIHCFDALSDTEKQDPILQFYKGYVFLKRKDFKAAEQTFATINQLPDTFSEAKEWYLLLSQLADKQDVKVKLQKIADNPKHSFQKKAKAVLKELY